MTTEAAKPSAWRKVVLAMIALWGVMLAGMVLLCLRGCDTEEVDRPAGRLVVQDERGAPIPGGTFTIIRHMVAPHHQMEPAARWQLAADASGQAMSERLMYQETSYPLMMHGVALYGWLVCAEAPGYWPVTSAWPREGSSSEARSREALERGEPLPELRLALEPMGDASEQDEARARDCEALLKRDEAFFRITPPAASDAGAPSN